MFYMTLLVCMLVNSVHSNLKAVDRISKTINSFDSTCTPNLQGSTLTLTCDGALLLEIPGYDNIKLSAEAVDSDGIPTGQTSSYLNLPRPNAINTWTPGSFFNLEIICEDNSIIYITEPGPLPYWDLYAGTGAGTYSWTGTGWGLQEVYASSKEISLELVSKYSPNCNQSADGQVTFALISKNAEFSCTNSSYELGLNGYYYNIQYGENITINTLEHGTHTATISPEYFNCLCPPIVYQPPIEFKLKSRAGSSSILYCTKDVDVDISGQQDLTFPIDTFFYRRSPCEVVDQNIDSLLIYHDGIIIDKIFSDYSQSLLTTDSVISIININQYTNKSISLVAIDHRASTKCTTTIHVTEDTSNPQGDTLIITRNNVNGTIGENGVTADSWSPTSPSFNHVVDNCKNYSYDSLIYTYNDYKVECDLASSDPNCSSIQSYGGYGVGASSTIHDHDFRDALDGSTLSWNHFNTTDSSNCYFEIILNDNSPPLTTCDIGIEFVSCLDFSDDISKGIKNITYDCCGIDTVNIISHSTITNCDDLADFFYKKHIVTYTTSDLKGNNSDICTDTICIVRFDPIPGNGILDFSDKLYMPPNFVYNPSNGPFYNLQGNKYSESKYIINPITGLAQIDSMVTANSSPTAIEKGGVGIPYFSRFNIKGDLIDIPLHPSNGPDQSEYLSFYNQCNAWVTYSDIRTTIGCFTLIQRNWEMTEQSCEGLQTQQLGVQELNFITPICAEDLTIYVAKESCDVSGFYTLPIESSQCSEINIDRISGLASGSRFEIGTHIIEHQYSYTDGSSDTCAFTITVLDTFPQELHCPPDSTVYVSINQCNSTIEYTTPSLVKLCQNATLDKIKGPDSGDQFSIGHTTIQYRATNENNIISDCQFIITLLDTFPPQLTCPSNITIDASQNCKALIAYDEPIAIGICDNASPILISGLLSQEEFPLGLTDVEYMITKENSLSDSCRFTVSVQDKSLANLICPNDITEISADTICGAQVSFNYPSVLDNCAPVTILQYKGSESGSIISEGISTIGFESIDRNNLRDSCEFTITVTDNTPPSIWCPPDITIQTIIGSCSATISYSHPIVSDNCESISPIQLSGVASGSSVNLGTTLNSFIAVDSYGRIAACSFLVEVIDSESPQEQCQDTIFVDTDPDICSAIVNFNYPTAFDNCNVTTTNLIEGSESGTSLNIGIHNIVFEFNDAANNKDTCTTVIVVSDHQSPQINCPSDIILYSDTSCTALLQYNEPIYLDNCNNAILELLQGPSTNTTIALEDTIVEYKVSDNAGNTSTCSFSIEVRDTIRVKISLIGSSEISLECDSTYIDEGIVLQDYCGATELENISTEIITNNNGYNIQYSHLDDNMNYSDTITRMIIVPDSLYCSIRDCLDSITITNDHLNSTTQNTFKAALSLRSNANIVTGNSMIFQASESVDLFPPFEIEASSELTIIINECLN